MSTVTATLSSRRTTSTSVTGADLARQRLALGLSLNAVAGALGVHPITLSRWEHDRTPVLAERRERWEASLRTCAQCRATQLAKEGFTLQDLPREMARLLRRYTADVGAGATSHL